MKKTNFLMMYDISTTDGSQDSSQRKGGEWKRSEYRLTKEQKETEAKLIRGKRKRISYVKSHHIPFFNDVKLN